MDAYGYCYQNPIKFIDLDGRSAIDPTEIFNDKGKKIGQDANGNVLIVKDNEKPFAGYLLTEVRDNE